MLSRAGSPTSTMVRPNRPMPHETRNPQARPDPYNPTFPARRARDQRTINPRPHPHPAEKNEPEPRPRARAHSDSVNSPICRPAETAQTRAARRTRRLPGGRDKTNPARHKPLCGKPRGRTAPARNDPGAHACSSRHWIVHLPAAARKESMKAVWPSARLMERRFPSPY
jgi:hypothetical protein